MKTAGDYCVEFKELISLEVLRQQAARFRAHLNEKKAKRDRLIARRDLLLKQNYKLNAKEIGRLGNEMGELSQTIAESEGFLLMSMQTIELLSGQVYARFKMDLTTHGELEALRSHFQTLLEMNEGLQVQCTMWQQMWLSSRQPAVERLPA